jgi:hypothetical protein
MNQMRTLTRMALHEMWISFRMMLLVVVPLVGGIGVIALPPELSGVTAVGGAGFWFAVAASIAIALASGVAALTMAHERSRGTVAWMAVRAVPRSAVLLSWFITFSILLAGGIVLGSVGAWLTTIDRAETAPDVFPFAAAVVASASAGLACVAGGLLLGTVMRAVPAMLLALGLTIPILVAAILTPADGIALPTGGIGLLAHLDTASRPLAFSLQAGGAALAVAGVLLVLASVGLERANL